ncbi:hypothetical protein CWC03_20930 [Pseudoalteromonas sp. S2755]|nr:hypothetical protein CWC03_20930 [Pseudoalteromonas sp. S2755]
MHFYVTSFEPDAQMLQKAIRHHWHIENQQHWVLDVVFKEDACQISEPISAENMALFRRVVRNLAKQHTGRKDSIRGKCVRASFDDEFRAELIFEYALTLGIVLGSSFKNFASPHDVTFT